MRNTLRIVMDDDLLQAASDAFGGVFVIAGHLTRLTDDGLADWGLTTRGWLLLAVLARGIPGRSPTLTEAAGAYGTSRQNVKQIAVGLEARGWLRLVPDPRDGRAIRLELTERVRIFDEPDGRDRGRALIEAAFDGLTRDEVLDLRRLVGRWLAGVARDPSGQARPGKVQES
jgi:DNA-binding MarR family transcriptional regulator